MGNFEDITSSDGFVFPAYVALPKDVPIGAIVVLQEIFGVNTHIQDVVNSYAEQGYLTVAPSTFQRIQSNVNLGYTADDLSIGKNLKTLAEGMAQLVMDDVQAAIDFASDQLLAGGKVGIVGYCWGGLLTWRAAATLTGISAAVPYYGAGVTVGAEASRQPRCPVLVHFADQDASIPMDTVSAFVAMQPQISAHIYSAHHGFNCDQRGAYNDIAAELALKRTLDFFTTNLVAP